MRNGTVSAQNDYTFNGTCDVCSQQPILRDTGMCAVCTFGEADSLWEWLYERWEGKELRMAQEYLKDLQRSLAKSGMDFAPEINRRARHLLSLSWKR